jgi:hypothetical protein
MVQSLEKVLSEGACYAMGQYLEEIQLIEKKNNPNNDQ